MAWRRKRGDGAGDGEWVTATSVGTGPVQSLPKHDRPDVVAAAKNRRWELVAAIVFGLLAATTVRAYVVQISYIPSESMEPTLQIDDRVLVSRLSYRVDDPAIGDVIVFRQTDAMAAATGSANNLIKRVVATAGQSVEARNGRLVVDGVSVNEPAVPDGMATEWAQSAPFVVPDGHVFVMGDNRTNSADSRVYGPVDVELIIGRAVFVIWPGGNAGPI